IVLTVEPVVLHSHVLAFEITRFFTEPFKRRGGLALGRTGRHTADTADYRHRRLLRACRERPCGRRAAACGQQFPPSDCDCHTPLPREVRKDNDTTPRACSLHVQGGRMLVASASVVGFNCTTPAASLLAKRRHRDLARRPVAVRRRAPYAAGGGRRWRWPRGRRLGWLWRHRGDGLKVHTENACSHGV